MTAHSRVLADPARLQQVCEVCFEQTATIGLCYQELSRATADTYMQAANCQYPLSFKSYPNGSAFLHKPLTDGDVQP